jgi:hypothetical protein
MTAFEELTTALRNSNKIDVATRDLLLQFLAEGAPAFQSLESSALSGLLLWLAGGVPASPPPVVDHLNTRQVRALLEVVHVQMEDVLAERREELAAARAATAQLGQAALTLLARLLIAAL